MDHLQSRREFLKTSAKVMAGVALASAGRPLLNAAAETAKVEAAPHPFPYTKMDPDKTQELGYKGFYEAGGCARGVAYALFGQMAQNVGYPFNQIPVDIFANGAGGYGIGTLCGSLAAAVTFIGAVCSPADAKTVTQELFSWYRKAELPFYQPEHKSITTVSNSVNCLDSVGTYMDATGLKMGDEARMARCAGVTADVSKKTAELLNALYGL